MRKLKIRDIVISRFYHRKWQDGKRKYRIKNERDNPVAVIRSLLKYSGFYDLSNWDVERSDKSLGQLYLYVDKKIDDSATESLE